MKDIYEDLGDPTRGRSASSIEEPGTWNYELISALTHDRMLTAYTPIQNRFAGINPSCPVFNPITHTITLFTLATTSPVQRFRPTKTVDNTVSKQDK